MKRTLDNYSQLGEFKEAPKLAAQAIKDGIKKFYPDARAVKFIKHTERHVSDDEVIDLGYALVGYAVVDGGDTKEIRMGTDGQIETDSKKYYSFISRIFSKKENVNPGKLLVGCERHPGDYFNVYVDDERIIEACEEVAKKTDVSIAIRKISM